MPRFFKKIKFKKNKDLFILHFILAVILFSVFLLEFKIVGQAVYGDGRYYMAFTRSIYFSQNVDITDEMSHYWSPESNNLPASFDSFPQLQQAVKTTTYNFSLGISVIWIPIYFIADLIVFIFSKFDSSIVRNGYNDIYQVTLGIGNIIFVIGGLFMLSKLLSKFYSKQTVILSILLILFATNLFYYSSIDVVNSHPFSFFGATLLLYLFFKYKEKKKIKILFIQGIILGLMISNRMQDGLLIIVPLFNLLENINLKKLNINLELRKIFLFISGLLTGYSPQLFLLYLGQKKLLLIPHLFKAQNDFMPFTHLTDIIFDQKLGIIFYMPIVLFSFVGLILLRKREKQLGIIFLLTAFSVFFLISSYDGWNVAGYTLRYFISIFPILAFGLAEVIIYIQKRFSNVFLYLVVFIFIFYQGLSILAFKLFWQDPTYVGSQLSGSGQLKIQILEFIYKYLSLNKLLW